MFGYVGHIAGFSSNSKISIIRIWSNRHNIPSRLYRHTDNRTSINLNIRAPVLNIKFSICSINIKVDTINIGCDLSGIAIKNDISQRSRNPVLEIPRNRNILRPCNTRHKNHEAHYTPP